VPGKPTITQELLVYGVGAVGDIGVLEDTGATLDGEPILRLTFQSLGLQGAGLIESGEFVYEDGNPLIDGAA
jgi:hypothetical protein